MAAGTETPPSPKQQALFPGGEGRATMAARHRDGKPFYSVGVNHVTASNNTDRDPGICPYCEVVHSIYDTCQAWAEATSQRSESWGCESVIRAWWAGFSTTI